MCAPTPFSLKDWECYEVSRYVPPGSVSPKEGRRSVPADQCRAKWGTIERDLDEWFALKVGVTRTNAPNVPFEYRGKLGEDPGPSREAVLRAATINAAYELHEDDVTGSVQIGKFADLIVLDRDPLKITEEDIGNVHVLQTVVGGQPVYESTPKH